MKRNLLGLVVMVAFTAPASILYAQSNPAQVDPTTMPAVAAQPIAFERETLPNGLRVIYAPMNNAPVVHVRVLYHVGSKDEAADRQGFAHMFEHMMFRGSEHVPSEQHMKLIQKVGGVSNAFTSFDQTTYVNTVPNNQLEMALWLEADRMASFKVGDDVLATERNVVKEEWRLRYANQPFGAMSQDLFGLAFKTHNYKWLPIGDMDQLAMAQTSELQDFHDRFYTPNNACLVVAGQFDVGQAKRWVRDYYAWIKPGPA
jgi:zinc protease